MLTGEEGKAVVETECVCGGGAGSQELGLLERREGQQNCWGLGTVIIQ